MDKFLAEISGDGFTLSMQGSGDAEKAKTTLSVVFVGCSVNVTVREFGDDMDLETG